VRGAHSFLVALSLRPAPSRSSWSAVILAHIHSGRYAAFSRSRCCGSHSGNSTPALYSTVPTVMGEESLHSANAATRTPLPWASRTRACAEARAGPAP